jgi:glycosyltransferase involved in cell wall biosynthesis
MQRLVILVPVLRRPHRVAPLLASIARATTHPHRVVFIADPDDDGEIRAVQESGAGLLIHGGGYAAKIHAGVQATTEPLIFLGADDLDFHPGWFEAASARLEGRIRVVGVNDLGHRRVRAGRHATYFLVDRRYVADGTADQPGRLMHDGYHHLFVDDEFVGTAKKRGVIAFATDSIVEHLHPDFGRAPDDETYQRGRARFAADRRLFRSRRHLWA